MLETFVLIIGARHGGWAWRPVAEHLRAARSTAEPGSPSGWGARTPAPGSHEFCFTEPAGLAEALLNA